MSPSKKPKTTSRKSPWTILAWVVLVLVVIFSVVALIRLGEKKTDQKPPKKVQNEAKPKTPPLETKTETFQLTDKNFVPYHQSIPILMYHHIGDFGDSNDYRYMYVTTENFRLQMSALKEAGFQTITFNHLLNKEIPAKPIIISFDDGYEDNYTKAYPILKENNQTAIIYMPTNFIGLTNYLSKDQLQTMLNYGLAIDSHTINHSNLSSLSETEAIRQIKESKVFLEKEFKQPINSFSYPYGALSDATETVVRNSNYGTAVVVTSRASSNNLYTLPRIEINHKDDAETMLTKIESFKEINNRFTWNY